MLSFWTNGEWHTPSTDADTQIVRDNPCSQLLTHPYKSLSQYKPSLRKIIDELIMYQNSLRIAR